MPRRSSLCWHSHAATPCSISAALLVFAIGFSLITTGGSAAVGATTQKISGISRQMLGSVVLLQGTVTSYTPPRSARSPHSFMLRDSTGVIRIVIWQNLWAGIPFGDKLKTDGQQVTMRVEIAEFQNALEGHLRAPGEIALGATIPPESTVVPGRAVAPAGAVTPSPNLYVDSSSASSRSGPPSAIAAGGVVLPGGVVVPATSSPATAPVKIEWKNDINAAQAESRRLGRKILIFFHIPGESTGELALSGVFSDSALSAIVAADYVPLRINPSQHPGFKNTGVAPGSYAVYNSDGRPEKTIPPVKSAAELAAALM